MAFLLAFSGPVQAQEVEPQSSGTSDFMDAIVVTAGRTEERIRSLSVPITIIDEKDIERTGAQTMSDLLKQYGVMVNVNGPGLARVGLRGFITPTTPNEGGSVLILLDGRRIGNNNIASIPLQNIGRVEIIRGAASTQYGSEATGGVINMISKRGSEQFTAFVEQGFGSNAQSRTQAGFSGMSGKFDFSLGGSYYKNDDLTIGNNMGKYDNTVTDHRILGGLNLGYNFNEYHRLGLVANVSDIENGRTGNFYPDTGLSQYPDGVAERGNHSWDIKYDGTLPDSNLSWSARYFQGETTYMTMRYPWEIPEDRGYLDYSGNFKGANLSSSWNNQFLYLSGGFDYYGIDYVKSSGVPPTSHSYDYAGYLHAKLALFEDSLWLTAGARYDKFDMESAGDGEDIADVVLKRNRVTPSFGVAYLPTDWLKLRANYSTSFKMPEPSAQMNYAGRYDFLPNPNLQPESSKGWEVGSDIYYNGLTLGLTYFSVDYEDKIETVTVDRVGPTDVRQYQNIKGITEYRGLEFNADWQMGDTFGWNFELKPYVSLTKMFRYYSLEEESNVSTVSDLSVSYGVTFNDEDTGWAASIDAVYFGIQDPHRASAYAKDYGVTKFGGETTVDLHLAKRVYEWEDAGRVILKADVLNVTDRLVSTTLGYPEAGRSFMFSLRYEY